MSSPDPNTPAYSAAPPQNAPTLATEASGATRRNSRRLWAMSAALLIAVAAGWFANTILRGVPVERPTREALAIDVSGGWWSITGDRYLQLDWDGRRATLWDYSASDEGVMSSGSWRTTDHAVTVQVSGAAGELAQEFELVGNDAEAFLAPAPAASAKLMDSWIADHGEDDDDTSQKPKPVEAAWRLPGRT